ncbi:MAG: protein kinase [bacterium]|nr:protein kinase [bacterium]
MNDRTLREQPTPSPGHSDPATHREDRIPEVGPTHREDGRPDSVWTHLEQEGAGSRMHPGSSPLPDELSGTYHFLTQMPPTGGEAHLYEVTEVATGEPRILKLYHPHVKLKVEALGRIRALDSAHTVRLIDYDRLSDGRWYEVQERVACGNLVDYRRRMGTGLTTGKLKDVVAELSAAIAAFHDAGLAHHDIKPENVLVRSDTPLDLVLGDFGLAVVADNRTYHATSRNATITYQAPEMMRMIGGEPRDYWALGLTIAMLATGKQPYADLNLQGILDQHHKRVPPSVVESMAQGPLKQLCRGLTRYDPKVRWTIQEVRRWLEGDTPKVVAENPSAPTTATRGVPFNQQLFSQPSDLAAAIVRHWALAAGMIGVVSRRNPFMDKVILEFGTDTLAELAQRWADKPPSGHSIDTAIVELVVALDPTQPAWYGERPLTRDSIAAAALGDSDADRRFVEALHDQQILEAWARSSHNTETGEIGRQWRAALSRAEEIILQARSAGANVPPIEDWAAPLLSACAQPRILDNFKWQRPKSRPTGRHVPGWYQNIATGSSLADTIAAALLADEANRFQHTAREAERRDLARTRRERRTKTRRWLLRLSGRFIALAFVGAAVLEWQAGRTIGAVLFPFGSPLFGWQLPLLVLAVALLGRWNNSKSDRRRAEAYGLVAAASIMYWYLTNPPSLSGLQLEPDFRGLVSLSQLTYGLAAGSAFVWSILSFADRRTEGSPTDQEIESLQRTDRRTLRTTALITLTCVVPGVIGIILIVTPLGDNIANEEFGRLAIESPRNIATAAVARGVPVPLIVASLNLIIRGRWAYRRKAVTWALTLLLVGAIAWPVGQSIAGTQIHQAGIHLGTNL